VLKYHVRPANFHQLCQDQQIYIKQLEDKIFSLMLNQLKISDHESYLQDAIKQLRSHEEQRSEASQKREPLNNSSDRVSAAVQKSDSDRSPVGSNRSSIYCSPVSSGKKTVLF